MARLILSVSLIFLVFTSTFSNTQAYTKAIDRYYGYSVYLPEHWTRVVDTSTGQHFFYDTSGLYKGIVSVYREAITRTEFPSVGDWTIGNFTAQKLYVQNSEFPDGRLLYFRDTTASRQQSLWAPEMWANFYSIDTLPATPQMMSWSEFTRFTEAGEYGYELYALSDTADMMDYLGLYISILNSIIIPLPDGRSADAFLWSLGISTGRLYPYFSPLISAYTAEIGLHDSLFFLVPEAGDQHASITVNGAAVASGEVSQPFRIPVGDTLLIETRVTAEDGTVLSYYLWVNRTDREVSCLPAPLRPVMPPVSSPARYFDPAGRILDFSMRRSAVPAAPGVYLYPGKKACIMPCSRP